MNLIEPFTDEIVTQDMSPTAALSFTIFLGAALGGFYFYDMFQRWKKTDERLDFAEQKLYDTSSLQEAHADTLEEYDQRIREKQDYDESCEIQEDKYQAWQGIYRQDSWSVEINLWREKETKINKNQAWVAWTGENDGSTTVRDFYLGNLNPDFQWAITESPHAFTCRVSETFVESWDNVIRLDILLTFCSKESLLEFLGTSEFWPNLTVNSALKKIIQENFLLWERVLIDVIAK